MSLNFNLSKCDVHGALSSHDAVELTAALVAYKSMTPRDEGCLLNLCSVLEKHGFKTQVVVFGETTNLYARFGTGSPHLCFAGHTDVVPPGDDSKWTFPPFSPTILHGNIYGRGTADMKGAIACFLSAFYELKKDITKGSCSLLLTSDEEGTALDGIQKMIPLLQGQNEIPDVILIGEPTGNFVGEVLQVGRRGSITGHLRIIGTQGHIAYPSQIDNPLPRLIACLHALINTKLDQGMEAFEASRCELTSIDTGNSVSNITPNKVEARFGIRFNPLHTSVHLCEMVEKICSKHAGDHKLSLTCHGDPFITNDKKWIQCIQKAITKVKGKPPRHTTQGGTTDGRFLHRIGPVLEIGLPEATIHQVNEHVAIEDIKTLRLIYLEILKEFFGISN